MQRNEIQQFTSIWAAAWEQAGASVTATAIELAFEALHEYPIHDIRRALTMHMRDPSRGRFPPKVADVISILRPTDASDWPSSDEAWAICVRSFDEMDTVIVTDEIMQAREASQAVMDLGDEVGARMAFRECYDRAVSAARFSGHRPRWWVSNGADPEMRARRVTEAVRIGRLAKEHLQFLPGPAMGISDTIHAIEKLGPTSDDVAEKRARAVEMLRLIQKMNDEQRVESERSLNEREEKRAAVERRRNEVVSRAEAVLREKGNGTGG